MQNKNNRIKKQDQKCKKKKKKKAKKAFWLPCYFVEIE